MLAITVSSVTTEPFIVSEPITTCLKAIELVFRNIKRLWSYYSFSVDGSIISAWLFKFLLTKQFFFNIWTADNLNIVDPSFCSFLRDLQIDNTLLMSAKILLKVDQRHNISVQSIIAFQGVIHPNRISDWKIRAI